MQRLFFTLLLIWQVAPNSAFAQLQVTVDGGFATAVFDQKPTLPAVSREIFGLTDGQTERIEPIASGYFGISLAQEDPEKFIGWSTRLQFMKRGYRYQIEGEQSAASPNRSPAQSYTSFIDFMAQATKTVGKKLRINAGPYASFAIQDEKFPTNNLNGPDRATYPRIRYGINVGASYPFGRLSIAINYQQSLRRYSFSSLNEASNDASGLSDRIIIYKEPRIGALRLGLEYAIVK